jgi:hypothetical protein
LRAAGADKVDAMLLQARDQLLAWLPVLDRPSGANGVAPADKVLEKV